MSDHYYFCYLIGGWGLSYMKMGPNLVYVEYMDCILIVIIIKFNPKILALDWVE